MSVTDASVDDVQTLSGSAYPPSIQAGIPRLVPAPLGWKRARLGELLTAIYRPTEIHDDVTYQLVTAKRNRGGIVARERLTGAQIKVKDQYMVRTGDFIISNRQISHGGCGLVPPELEGAIVSGEYTVLNASGPIDLKFLNHFAHSVYFQQICFHSSIGVHVEKLVFRLEEWFKWEVNLPPLGEQRQIANALDAWDRAIETTEALVKTKRHRLALVTKQVSADWTPVALGELGRWVGGGTPSKAEPSYWSNGSVPWVSPKDMGHRRVYDAESSITEQAIRESSATKVPKGSVLLVTRSGILRSRVPVAVAMREVAINQDLKALLPSAPVDGELLSLLLIGASEKLRQVSMKTGTTVESLDFDAVKAFELRVPKSTSETAAARELIVGMANDIDQTTRIRELRRSQKIGLVQKLLTGEWKFDRTKRTAEAAA